MASLEVRGQRSAVRRQPLSRQSRARLSPRAARDRPESGASDRQDAVQLPLGRADPPGVPAGNHYSWPPRCCRHGSLDPSNSFPSEPGVSDRRPRTGRVFPQLPAADRPLAERSAGGPLPRGRLRGANPRARTRDPADHRGLRPAVARRLPAPRIQSAGCEDSQQVADPAANLSQLRRPLATLRTLVGTTGRAGRLSKSRSIRRRLTRQPLTRTGLINTFAVVRTLPRRLKPASLATPMSRL